MHHSFTLRELGGLPERPMGADCKSAGYAFSGSNPLPTTMMAKDVNELDDKEIEEQRYEAKARNEEVVQKRKYHFGSKNLTSSFMN
jgi:hypothetical protein